MNHSRQYALRKRAQAHPTCPDCVFRSDSPEVYTIIRYWDNALLAFDVDLAHNFCRDGRAAKEVEIEILDAVLQVNSVTPAHVDHVDTNYPGIACPVDYTPEGEPVMALIDGSHRAAKCRKEGIPFFAFQLSAEEARRCQQTDAARTCRQLEMLVRSMAF
jgi:hypothetical protein